MFSKGHTIRTGLVVAILDRKIYGLAVSQLCARVVLVVAGPVGRSLEVRLYGSSISLAFRREGIRGGSENMGSRTNVSPSTANGRVASPESVIWICQSVHLTRLSSSLDRDGFESIPPMLAHHPGRP